MLINTSEAEFAPTENTNTEYTQYLTAGKRILAPVGFMRGQSSQKGTPYIEIGFVCVQDLDEKGEEGRVTTRKFWITEKAIAQFGKFLSALGFRSQIDTDVDSDIEKALGAGYTKAFLKTETYTKRDGTEGSSSAPAFFDPCPQEQPEWEQHIADVSSWWDKYVEYQNSKQSYSAPANDSFESGDVPF